MKRATFTVFLCLSFLFSTQAQHQGDSILYEYKQDQQEYFDSLRLVLEKDGRGMEGTGYKSFQSHLHVWEPLVYPSGDYRPAEVAQQNALRFGNDIRNKYVDVGWEELGPFDLPQGNHVRHRGTGRITSIVFHPTEKGTMFCTSPNGGLYVSYDYGENWINGGTDHLPCAGVGAIVAHPFKPGYWIVATGDGDGDWTPSAGIFRTTDGGKTWEDISNGLFVPKTKWNALRISKLVAHPTNFNIVYAATNKGLFRCGNSSSKMPIWKALIDKEPFTDIEFQPDNSGVMYASGRKIYKSINNGSTWNLMKNTSFTNIGYDLIRVNLEISEANPRMVYAVVTGGQKKKGTYKAQLYRYDFGSDKWESRGRVLDPSYIPYGLIPGREKAFAVSPRDANKLYASNVNPIVESDDGGSTWKPGRAAMHDDIHHIIFNGDTMWTATDGGVYKSVDLGVTWQSKSNGLGVANVHAISTSNNASNKVSMGTYDTGSSLYDVSRGGWFFATGGDGYSTMIDKSNDSIVYTSAVGGTVWRSDDGWTSGGRRNAHKYGAGSNWQTWVVMDPEDSKTIYQCGHELWRSSDRGARNSWVSILNVKEQFPDHYQVLRAYVAPSNRNVVYAILIGGKGHPMKIVKTTQAFSENVQETWEEIEHPVHRYVIGLAIDDVDPNVFWLAYSGITKGFFDKVWLYNGKRWKSLAFDLPEWVQVKSIAHQNGSNGGVYIGTSKGVFVNEKKSRQWIWLKGLPHCEVRDIKFNYVTQKVLVGTFGRGVWQGSLYW